MPELPEVETAMRGLRTRLTGRKITAFTQRRADLRFPLPERLNERLVGRRIVRFGRRAKYILAFLDDGQSLMLHLGMSGRLLFDGPAAGIHEHLTFGFDDGTCLRYVDPRRFGMLDLIAKPDLETHPRLKSLGVEPTGDEFNGKQLAACLSGRKTPLKVAIMNQALLVGVGNIYASESLFRARLSPQRTAGLLQPKQYERLAGSIKEVLAEAIEAGGSSLRDYVQTDGELGYFQHAFRVYGREGLACPSCGRPILKVEQANRATFFCGYCQR